MELPLFPLHLVLFPGGRCPLHVFEPRYRQMFERVLDGDRRFGIVAIERGVEVGGPAETAPIGCVAEVETVRRTSDGRLALIAGGRARFRIAHRFPDDPYPVADVEPLADEPGFAVDVALTAARAALVRYLSALARARGSDLVLPRLPIDAVAASHAIATCLRVDVPTQQRLLDCDTAAERLSLASEIARREAALMTAFGPQLERPVDAIPTN